MTGVPRIAAGSYLQALTAFVTTSSRIFPADSVTSMSSTLPSSLTTKVIVTETLSPYFKRRTRSDG